MAVKKYVEVKAYLEPDKDKELIETLARISKNSGLSMSAVLGLVLKSRASVIESALKSALKSGADKRAVKR